MFLILWNHEERRYSGIDAQEKHYKVDAAAESLALDSTCVGRRIAAQKIYSSADAWNHCHDIVMRYSQLS